MKKNERVCAITKILTDNPNRVLTYNYFSQLFEASKTSVCEDVAIVKSAVEVMKMGKIILYHGTSDKIVQPAYGRGDEKHDYGKGFYLWADLVSSIV